MTKRKKMAKIPAARMSRPQDLRRHSLLSFRAPDVYVDGKLKTDGPTLDQFYDVVPEARVEGIRVTGWKPRSSSWERLRVVL